MVNTRLSTPADLPAQKELWALAFGDDGAYVDNFYENYYRPGRVMVLEEDGVVRAMTAWFDTDFVLAGGEHVPAAYLYAVATHPDCRGRGFAARLLRDIGVHLRDLGYPALTTVPAEPSLHNFFGVNGFRECFVHSQYRENRGEAVHSDLKPEVLAPADYCAIREKLLDGTPHIAYPLDSVQYQAGCCAVSGGGLYGVETPAGPVCLCAEGMEDGSLMLKELLGCEQALDTILPQLSGLFPAFSGIFRTPGPDVPFGMLRWLDPVRARDWDWHNTAYMGLAFD